MMRQHIFSSVKLTIACLMIFMGLYPLFILLIAQAGPNRGRGETLSVDGKVIGYALEGQSFTQDRYFWGRPSAAGYNAASSAASNKGPSNPEYLKLVQDRTDSFLAHNPGVNKAAIPAELVTASGSGLDPDISPEAAYVQVKRIAAVRKIQEGKLSELISKHTITPLLGFMGTTKINVLQLNIELDKLKMIPQ